MQLTNHNQEISQRILAAAQKRLWHYGFKKTTMEEIAQDAGISKGAIYLHFTSKEEIVLAIVAQFKQQSLDQARGIAHDPQREVLDKLKAMLVLPLLAALERCRQSPSASEMITALRPNIHEHLKSFFDEEIRILAEVLEQGNAQQILAIDDTIATARLLKQMCAGFWPPYLKDPSEEEIVAGVNQTVDLAFRGFRAD